MNKKEDIQDEPVKASSFGRYDQFKTRVVFAHLSHHLIE